MPSSWPQKIYIFQDSGQSNKAHKEMGHCEPEPRVKVDHRNRCAQIWELSDIVYEATALMQAITVGDLKTLLSLYNRTNRQKRVRI